VNYLLVALGVVATGVAVVVAELSKNLFVTEAQTRIERLPLAILRLARRRLAARHREAVYQDEWLPELEFIARETGGLPITRLVRSARFALGLLRSARSISAARGDRTGEITGHALEQSLSGLPVAFSAFLHDTALTVREVLNDCPDAQVVSVEGSWGSGKTMVLERTQLVGLERGTTDRWFTPISFNPWLFQHGATPNRSMVAALESVVVEASQGQARPVVVFIDDLDRCDPHSVFTVLNALRFVGFHLPDVQVRFVLAFDPAVIVGALDRLLTTSTDSSGSTGQTFLDKVVQVPIRLPLPPAPLRGSLLR
jgi:hypothetical protein